MNQNAGIENSEFFFQILIDEKGRILSANAKTLRELELKDSDDICYNFFDLLHPMNHSDFKNAIRLAKENRCSYSMELFLKNGYYHPMKWEINYLKDDAAKENHFLCNGYKILNQGSHATSDVLNEQASLFSAFLEKTPSLEWIVDEEEKLIFASNAFYQYFRLDEKRSVGKKITDLVPAVVADALYEKHVQVLHSAKPITTEEKTKLDDGRETVFHIYIFPLEIGGKKKLIGGHAINITDRYEIEKQLREANERLLVLNRASSDAIWEWDMQTGKIIRNEALLDMIGYTGEKTKGLSWWLRRIHPEDRNRVSDKIKEITEKGKLSWQDEYRFKFANGEYRYIRDNGYVVYENELPVKMVGSLQDVTVLKELEDQLSEEKEQQRNFLKELIEKEALMKKAEELADFGSWEADMLTGKTQWSDGAFRMFGYKSGEIESSYQLFLYHIHPEDRDKAKQRSENAFANPHSNFHKDEFRIVDKNGNIKYIHSELIIERNQEGEPIRLVGFNQDITEQKKTEKEIKRSNERFELVSRATNDMIWDWDLKTGKIFRNAEGVKNVYGFEDESQINTDEKWLRRIHPDDLQKVKALIEEIHNVGKQELFSAEYRFLREDGTYAYIYDRGYIIRNRSGKPLRMIGAAQDMTEKKDLELRLLEQKLNHQKEVSETAIRVQEQERTRIGHELHDNVNQILGTVKLFVELLSPATDQQREIKEKSINYLLSAIEEIRSLSKQLVAPQLKNKSLVESIRGLMDDIHLSTKIKIKFTHDHENGLITEGKKITLFRIVQEQLKNILKYSQAKKVEIFLQCKNGKIELIVKDDGVGFDMKQINKGIGFSNIQDRTRFYNGAVEIRSEPGKGCQLSVIIPSDK